jgi:parallel beta-helix repeat protein
MKRLYPVSHYVLTVLVMALCLPVFVTAQTEILEDVTANTTWDASGSPYVIMKASGRVLVPKGVTLTIDPGVTVEFPGGQSMLAIKGTLNAIGTSGNRITFTRGDGFTELWHTIQFNAIEGEGAGTLQYCDIVGGGGPLSEDEDFHGAIDCIFAASPTIDNCNISDCKNGIYSTKESTPTISNNSITGCERYGLFLENSSPVITGNTITGNTIAGIYQKTDGDGSTFPQYSNNIFGIENPIILTGTVQNSGHWENPDVAYVINEELRIQAGATLTIDPGVEIQFNGETNVLEIRGLLVAEGTVSEPILMTKVPTFNGTWHGLDFSGVDVSSSRMSYVIIEYSGSDLGGETFVGAVQCVNGAAPSFTDVTIRNSVQGFFCHGGSDPVINRCTIQDNSEYGIYVVNSSPAISNSTIKDNTLGGAFVHTLAGGIAYPKYDANTFGPNDRIHLQGNADQNGTIEYAATPYVISQNMVIQDVVELTVEPGVIFQFMNAEDKLTVYGTLTAEGTANDPITFTRAPELSTTWENIEFVDERSDSSSLDYVIVEHAGGVFDDESNLGAIELTKTASPHLNHCTIRNSQNGILCFDQANPLIENCTIVNNNRFGINAINSSPVINSCNISGNGAGGLQLNTSGIGEAYPKFDGNTWGASDRIVVIGNLQESGTWEYAGTPYLIDDELRIERLSTLTIEPGTEIQFSEFTAGLKATQGRIVAIGTHNEPILFTKAPELAGVWNRVNITSQLEDPSEFVNCIFEYGGFSILPGQNVGMITADNGTSPLIRKCIIRNSDNIGVMADNDAMPVIRNCIIENNKRFGVYNNKKVIVDARYCWWGDATGPHDPSDRPDDPTGLHNPDGQGDEVSNYVDYTEWLSVATGVEPVQSLAGVFTLYQNYPNPFNPTTTISYKIEKSSTIVVQIFDLNGALVRTLFDGHSAAGSHTLVWDGTNHTGQELASGTYIYQLQSGTSVLSKTMSLNK